MQSAQPLTAVFFAISSAVAVALLTGCSSPQPSDDDPNASTYPMSAGTTPIDATMPATVVLIDDFEKLTPKNPPIYQNGFSGGWYYFDDGSIPSTDAGFSPNKIAVTTEALGAPHNTLTEALSAGGLHARGGPYTGGWGSGFNGQLSNGRPFDASDFSGMIFWAKRANAKASPVVRVGPQTVNDDPMFKICQNPPTEGAGSGCGDFFSMNLELGDDWRVYTVPFTELRQLGFGYAPPDGFAKNAITGISFLNDPGAAFDEWIDDIGFYK
jgi:hypothetical protein